MKPRILVLVLAGLFLTPLAGCGEPDGLVPADQVEPGPDGSGSFAPETYSGRYRASGLVLENADHGPQLCRNVATSLPPQCGGPDIVNWSWDGLDHEEVDGVRYGSFEVVGTYDGKRFTLTEPPRPPRRDRQPARLEFTSPCPPPAGGWRVLDAAKATHGALREALALAEASPGSAGVWIDQNGGENDPKKLVVNVRVTGDPAVEEARLREVWGGALCVTTASRTTADLLRVQAELATLPGILSTAVDPMTNLVHAEVYVATDARRQELDARFGPGVTRLTGFLEPI